jgi:hypothetical protein
MKTQVKIHVREHVKNDYAEGFFVEVQYRHEKDTTEDVQSLGTLYCEERQMLCKKIPGLRSLEEVLTCLEGFDFTDIGRPDIIYLSTRKQPDYNLYREGWEALMRNRTVINKNNNEKVEPTL